MTQVTTPGSPDSARLSETAPFLQEDGEVKVDQQPRRRKTVKTERQIKGEEQHVEVKEKVAENRGRTNMKADLQTRTLQATLRLARRSFEDSKTEKGTLWFMKPWVGGVLAGVLVGVLAGVLTSVYAGVPAGVLTCVLTSGTFAGILAGALSQPGVSEKLSQQMRGSVPDLKDFKRAFNLIHDWYPKLHEEVRIHRETWEGCTEEVLSSMLELLDEELIKDETGSFKQWASDVVEKQHDKAKRAQIDGASKALKSMQKMLDANMYNGDIRKIQAVQKLLEDITVKSETEISDMPAPSESHHAKPDETSVTCGEHFANCKSRFCNEHENFDKVRQNLQAMYALICGPSAADSKAEDNLLVKVKMPFLRVMWIILMLDFFFMYEASALGFLSQIFLELNIDMAKESGTLKMLPLVVLPLGVLVYAIIGSMLADLVHGSFAYPPFKIARARLIILLTPLLSNKDILHGDDLARCPIRFIDLFLTDGLLILTLGGGLMFSIPQLQGDESLMDSVLNGLNTGALCWTTLCVILIAISRMYCNIWKEYQMEEGSWISSRFPHKDAHNVVFRPTRCVFILRDALQAYGILPGETWTYFLSLQRYLEIHKLDDTLWNAKQVPDWVREEENNGESEEAKIESWKAYASKLAASDRLLDLSHYHRGYQMAIAGLIVWGLTGLICVLVDVFTDCKHKGIVLLCANVGLTATALFSSLAAERFLPQLTSGTMFRFHFVIFLALIYGFSVITTHFAMDMDATKMKPMMSTDPGVGRGIFYNEGKEGNNSATPYPACSMSWGSPPVRLLDLAAMAYYAYLRNETKFDEFLNESFQTENRSVERLRFDDFDDLPRIVASRICRTNTEPEPCTVIMAVKGTSTRLEVMTDLGIFSTVSVLQMLDIIAPLMGTVPISVLSYMIDWFRLPFLKHTQKQFVNTIEDAFRKLHKEHPRDSFVISGHSLGGNFAELAGAKLRIPAVGFSAPGQFYMMKPFDISRQAIAENIMTIIPSMDVIPHVAKHVDIVQRILCRRKNGKYRKPQECHSISATGCEIWRVCGDIQGRNFSEHCLDPQPGPKEALVSEACVGKVYNASEDAPCRLVADR